MWDIPSLSDSSERYFREGFCRNRPSTRLEVDIPAQSG